MRGGQPQDTEEWSLFMCLSGGQTDKNLWQTRSCEEKIPRNEDIGLERCWCYRTWCSRRFSKRERSWNVDYDESILRNVFTALGARDRFVLIRKWWQNNKAREKTNREVSWLYAHVENFCAALYKTICPLRVTVDEQLVAFRGEYVISTPAKYGVKIWAFGHNKTI